MQCKAEETVIINLHDLLQVFSHFLFPVAGKRAVVIVDLKLIPNVGGIFADGHLRSKLLCMDKVISALIVKLDISY